MGGSAVRPGPVNPRTPGGDPRPSFRRVSAVRKLAVSNDDDDEVDIMGGNMMDEEAAATLVAAAEGFRPLALANKMEAVEIERFLARNGAVSNPAKP